MSKSHLLRVAKSLFGIGALCVLAQLPAQANSFTSVCSGDVYAIAQPNPSINQQFGCPVTTNASATDTIVAGEGQIATFAQAASAPVGGSVSPGLISLSGTASASSTPGSYVFLEPDATVNNDELAAAEAQAQASWTDSFTVNGPSNTTVDLLFTMTFDSIVSSTGFDESAPIANDVLSVNNTGVIFINHTPDRRECHGWWALRSDYEVQTGSSFSVQNTVLIDTGTVCAGGLFSNCDEPDIYVPTSSGVVDASHTGLVFVQDLTPGTSFATASGSNYAPVSTHPEPSSLLLLATGLLGLGPLLRRRISRL